MKEKFLNNIKSLFKSITNNRILFDRRKNSFLSPLIIFILTICMMILPTYFSNMNTKSNDIVKNFPEISAPMEKLLTSSLDCSVKDKILVCNENAEQINIVIGEDIKYTLVVNQSSFSANTAVEYSNPKDTDNLIILLKQYIKIRYIQRDYVKEEIVSYEIIGDYSELEGFNFKQVSEKLKSNPDLLQNEVNNFVHKAYISTLDTQLIVNLSSSLLSFLLLVLVSSLILKWPTLIRRKKGFKFRECLKIAITSSLPALLIGVLLFFSLGMEFALPYGIIYIVRVLYIYFKYIISSKNNIFKQLYEETNEERFKI